MEIVKLEPAVKDYIWGGTKLKSWGKKASTPTIAECWELSFNKDGPSLIASGPDSGKPLCEVATKEDLGPSAARFPFFPTLIKLIDAAKDLSVQVHPSDDYALNNEGQYGKTEMWHILEAEPGSGLYLGFKKETNAAEVRSAVQNGTILSLLNFYAVKPGETYFIPSGTVHAIGHGVTLIEIQQNSTLTYRLYDYGRLDKNGQPRPLHLEKALLVMNFHVYQPPKFKKPLLGLSPYFSVTRREGSNGSVILAKPTSFLAVTFLNEQGSFAKMPYRKGDTFFIPAGKKGQLEGSATYVATEVPEK